jgi:hypothetical protein
VATTKQRRDALNRALRWARLEVQTGHVTLLEIADWFDYALLREDGLDEVSGDMCQDDEEVADDAAILTIREYLCNESDNAQKAPQNAVAEHFTRMETLAQVLDPLFDEPLSAQETWL